MMHHNGTDHPGLRCTDMGKTYQVCINEAGGDEGWVLNEEVVQLIGSHLQVNDVELIHQEFDGGEE